MLGKGMSKGFKSFAGLYKGVLGAATGAGIYIGTYFAFYGATCNLLSKHTNLSPGAVAFVGGGIAAAGGSVVKVPLAVCIRYGPAPHFPACALVFLVCALSSCVSPVCLRVFFVWLTDGINESMILSPSLVGGLCTL